MELPRIGEIVASNTATFVAEVQRGGTLPAFGSWVSIRTRQGITILGVIGMVEYGSIVPGRRATALGLSHEELQLEMPQVHELLRVSFSGYIVGYTDASGNVIQALPPYPPGIHDFVHECPEATLLHFSNPPYDFLRLLVATPDNALPGDELLIAALRCVKETHHGDAQQAFLVQAGRLLSRLLKDDHERLQTILRRLQL